MMKANKQIGFININEESIDKIIQNGDVVFERGFLREKTSTTLPTTFDGVGKDLKDYRLYGNTYQNSTSGKNICLQANIIDTNTIRFDINSNEINRTFTLSLIPPLSVNSMSIVAFADGVNLRSVGTINLISGERSTATITLTESIYNTIQNASEVHFNLYKSGAGISTTSIIEEPQIENNSSFTSYEPYTGGQPSPNPDYPQEIISCGDKTKNMVTRLRSSTSNFINFYFDKNMATQNMILSGIFSYSVSNFTIFLQTSFGNESLLTNQSFTQNEKFSFDIQLTDTQLENIINSTTTPSIQFYRTGAMSGIGYSEIMLRASDTTVEYEPYGKYKIPINVRSENLFDKDNVNVLNAYISLGNSKITSSNSDKCLYMPIKNNTTYTISKILSSRFVIGCVDEEPVLNSSVCNPISGNQASNTTYTITSGNNSKYLVIFYYTTSDTLIEQQILDSIQVVEGSTTPDKYIPYYNETTNIYLDEPLRRIEDYFDYIDFINGKVVRKIKEDILNGNENWTAYGSNLYTVQKIYNNNPFIVGYGLSNLYIYNSIQSGINAGTVNGEFALQKSGQHYSLFIKNTDIGNLENLKSSLSIKNMTLQYPLETPTEEPITLPNIPTIDGNNILNIETEITPSQVYIKYKSNN